jgi:hypothetical protein
MPGNTIRKVYLCRAKAKGLKPGDILLFYLSRDRRLAASQSLTTVGIVEQCRESRTSDELVVMTARRSVFSATELSAIQARSPASVKVIDFLLASHMTRKRQLVDLDTRIELPTFWDQEARDRFGDLAKSIRECPPAGSKAGGGS